MELADKAEETMLHLIKAGIPPARAAALLFKLLTCPVDQVERELAEALKQARYQP